MAYTDPSTLNYSEGIDVLINLANEGSQGWLTPLILMAIYLITAFGVFGARNDLFKSFAVAGFLTFLIAVIFRVGNMINSTTMVIVTAVAILSVVGLFFPKD